MTCKTDPAIARTIGIDTGKNTLHKIGLDKNGAIVLREKVSRSRIGARLANIPRCLIGIEAGMATHYVARDLIALGHDVKQVPPARPATEGPELKRHPIIIKIPSFYSVPQRIAGRSWQIVKGDPHLALRVPGEVFPPDLPVFLRKRGTNAVRVECQSISPKDLSSPRIDLKPSFLSDRQPILH